MEMKKRWFLGAALIVVGLVLSLGSLSLTGFSVFENVPRDYGSFLGAAFILIGLFMLVEQTESKLEIMAKSGPAKAREETLVPEGEERKLPYDVARKRINSYLKGLKNNHEGISIEECASYIGNITLFSEPPSHERAVKDVKYWVREVYSIYKHDPESRDINPKRVHEILGEYIHWYKEWGGRPEEMKEKKHSKQQKREHRLQKQYG